MTNNTDKSTSTLWNYELGRKCLLSAKEAVGESLATIRRTIRFNDNASGVSTGLIDLDYKLSGFQNSDLIILAGRPSMGKTDFAVNFAFNACQNLAKKAKNSRSSKNCFKPKSVVFFSLETSAGQLSARLLSMMASVDSTHLRSGKVSEESYRDLLESERNLSEMPLFIDDTSAMTIDELRIKAKRMKEEENVGIIFVDYLQLLRSPNKQDNRTLEITEIMRGLKAIAKDLNIPVIALSQLSRDLEQREDKRPRLSDLRDSAAIEQDADVIMLLYREEYYLKKQEPEPSDPKYSEWQYQLDKAHNIAEIRIAKHRNGGVGNVQLYYIDKFSSIGNLERTY